ncbi:hypothetical protein E8L99_13090 [Phreatobacter aquaticus]|uniref:DUF1871 family protein n=1 Tax=Phreatobacter aquaticus TaxID=2570229 RepID=A0A4D7QI59_9HYPH|nr:hypothetical protein [Phreatobacter aquaticus]QCK86625.1 hypothetical protein E8L99_13090 [Phreatobacter aquaticus]
MTHTAGFQRIRQILMAHWDPIGIADVPACADEYDDYVRVLVRHLAGEMSQAGLAAYLVDIEIAWMGLTPNPDRAQRVAALLLAPN